VTDPINAVSGEITNLLYSRHIAKVAEEVVISTGMATLNEVGAAIDVFESNGVQRESITVLHCTSEYPAPFSEVNLRATPAKTARTEVQR